MNSNADKWQKFNEQQSETVNDETVAEQPATTNELQDPRLVELEKQVKETQEKYLRLQASFNNLERQKERDVQNAHKYSSEKILKALLPVVDSLEKSLELEKDQALLRGVQMTLDILLEVLNKHHVTAIDPQGALFDPSLHEAMATEVSLELNPNTVVKVFQKGYLLHDRLIRPALVVVAKSA